MAVAHNYAAAVRVAQAPAAWACETCGSTASLWICLHDGTVYCEDNDHVADHAARVDAAALWVEIQTPNRVFNWRTHRDPRMTDAALLAAVASIRNHLRDLQRMGGPKLAAARGWAKIRAAVRLFGHNSLSRPAQVERRKRDARETALLHWLHQDMWRAFRTWQRAVATPAPRVAPVAAIVEATSLPRKRDRGHVKGGVTFDEAQLQSLPPPIAPIVIPSRPRWLIPVGIRAMHGITGLRNLGNTCYMNSVLQALTHAPLFRALLFAVQPPSRRSIVDMLSSAVLGYEVMPTVVQTDTATGMPALPPLMPRLARSNSALADVMEGASPTHMQVATSPFIDPDEARASAASHSRTASRIANTKIAAPLHEVVSRMFGAGDQLAVYTPDAFLKAMWVRLPQFSGFNQQDAEEFLRALINALHEEAAGGHAPEGTTTRVSRSLGGTTVTSITCSVCGHVSRRTEAFLGPLGVEVPREFRTTSRRGAAGAGCTLSMCFASTFRDEVMEGDNAYACEPCNKKVKATMRVRLGELPPLLVVHVIRTDWMIQAKGSGSKIQTPVRVDVNDFDVSAWVEGATATASPVKGRKRHVAVDGDSGMNDGDVDMLGATDRPATTYALQGVVEHMGSGLRQGHYVAFARDGDDFYSFNDAKVAAVQDAVVAGTQCAYLMVFQRSDVAYV